MSRRTTHTPWLVVAGSLALLAALPMTGCRGDRSDKPPRQFFPDMDTQPRWNPQSETRFYADGRTMRQPVVGTVPFGTTSVVSDADWAKPFRDKRDEFLAEDYRRYDGTDDMGEFVTEIPVPVTANLMRLGQGKFNVYCATCHGINGEGANSGQDPERGSMVGRLWNIAVPTFDDPKYLPGGARGQDGYLFTVARRGVVNAGNQTMPGYAHALDTNESWAVVAYIRALQRSHLGTLGDVPEPERAALGSPPPPPPPAQPDPAPTEGQQ